MEHAFIRAAELGDDAIVILGSPADDVSQGFRSCKKSCVSAKGRRYPAAMPAKELIPGVPAGRRWISCGGPVTAISEEALHYDDILPPAKRCHRPSQEALCIPSCSLVE